MSFILKTWNADGARVKIQVSDELYQLCMEKKSFMVEIKNAEGRKVAVEVSKPVYELYKAGHSTRERCRKECANHLDDRTLDDYTLQGQVATELLERVVLRREMLHTVDQVLQSCTSIQRERFYLHAIYGYTFAEISKLQKCHITSVQKSVLAVKEKLEKFL